MKALVTGGGGFLGRYIVERLVARGDFVRVLGRSKYPELARPGIETVQGDLRDAAAVAKACEKIDVVFHVAALPAIWGRWRDFYAVNVQGTENVLAGCRARAVPRLVYTSTPSVIFDRSDLCNIDETYPYPDRYDCYYPETKAMAERLVVAANGREGLLTTALRPHLVWGPRDNHLIPKVLERARAGQLFVVGDGSNKVDVTYVENAADAHLQAADHLRAGSPVAGQVYFISQGEPVVLWDFINRLLERLGIPKVDKAISYRTAKSLGAALEVVHTLLLLSREPRMTRFLAAQLAKSHYFDVSRAKRDFGYAPRITTAEGLERLVAYLQNQ
ncbi:MAG: NAD-dependent epimerase/dehydratase family protein [Deltaproteobacteria bacterium]|nr:NAD-dependent epimerase/dehydratase family protein [Deltaproteobacteria bacterium]MBI2209091.1 NAD-dependent epimerase/dehydratase family protein [Deltaproteobacteria bacterium]MBI2347397.1 NAD-dependent epimerase/dehydratase family protein [Deltaproteobacteria bacterium]MBI2992302.1 NAD-dependent epimerase/dehydratase family protein [Deltaproteobacteria bacterium]